jgi:hypothetical protein
VTEQEMTAVQAAAENITPGGKIELAGRTFATSGKPINSMRMMRFAKKASSGLGPDQLEGMAVVYDMLRDAVDPADWEAFEQHAMDAEASLDDLIAVMMGAVETTTGRPTVPPSGS